MAGYAKMFYILQVESLTLPGRLYTRRDDSRDDCHHDCRVYCRGLGADPRKPPGIGTEAFPRKGGGERAPQ